MNEQQLVFQLPGTFLMVEVGRSLLLKSTVNSSVFISESDHSHRLFGKHAAKRSLNFAAEVTAVSHSRYVRSAHVARMKMVIRESTWKKGAKSWSLCEIFTDVSRINCVKTTEDV